MHIAGIFYWLIWSFELVIILFQILIEIIDSSCFHVIIPFAIEEADLLVVRIKYEPVESIQIVAKPSSLLEVDHNPIVVGSIDHFDSAVLSGNKND